MEEDKQLPVDQEDQSLRAEVSKLVLRLLSAIGEECYQALYDRVVSRYVSIVHHTGADSLEQRHHRLLLLLLLINEGQKLLQQNFCCDCSTFLQMQKAQKRPWEHVQAFAHLLTAAGLFAAHPFSAAALQDAGPPASVTYRLTPKAIEFMATHAATTFSNKRRMSALAATLRRPTAHTAIARELQELQSIPAVDVTVTALCKREYLQKWMAASLGNMTDLQKSGCVSVHQLHQLVQSLGPLACTLVFGSVAVAEDHQQQQQRERQVLVDMLKELTQGPLADLLIVISMKSSLEAVYEPGAVQPDSPDCPEPEQLVYELRLQDGDNSLLAAVERLDARGSQDGSELSTDSNLHLQSDDARTSGDAVNDQQTHRSSSDIWEEQVFCTVRDLEKDCLSRSLANDPKLDDKLHFVEILLQGFHEGCTIIMYGAQVSAAAAAGLPINLMLIDATAAPTFEPEPDGSLQRDQAVEVATLNRLQRYLQGGWSLLLRSYKINLFGRFGPTAELSLACAGDESNLLRLHVSIGYSAAALHETAYVAHQMCESPRLRSATLLTQQLLVQAKGIHQLVGQDPEVHALVKMLLAQISKQPQQQKVWWGVDWKASVFPACKPFSRQRLLQHLQTVNRPAVMCVQDAFDMLRMLKMIWASIGLESYVQECIDLTRQATTVTAAATAAIIIARESTSPDDFLRRKRHLLLHRMYRSLIIDDATLTCLRLIFRHAAARLSLYLGGPDALQLPQLGSFCSAGCSDKLQSASGATSLVLMLVHGNVELQQLLQSKMGQGACVWGTPVKDLAQRSALPAAGMALAAVGNGAVHDIANWLHIASLHIADVLGFAAAAGNICLRATRHSMLTLNQTCRAIVTSLDELIQERKDEYTEAIKQTPQQPRGDRQLDSIKSHWQFALAQRYPVHSIHRSILMMERQAQTAAGEADRSNQRTVTAPDAANLASLEQLVKEASSLLSEQQQQQQQQQHLP